MAVDRLLHICPACGPVPPLFFVPLSLSLSLYLLLSISWVLPPAQRERYVNSPSVPPFHFPVTPRVFLSLLPFFTFIYLSVSLPLFHFGLIPSFCHDARCRGPWLLRQGERRRLSISQQGAVNRFSLCLATL